MEKSAGEYLPGAHAAGWQLVPARRLVVVAVD